MSCCGSIKVDSRLEHIANRHPCFSGEANFTHGRLHLPVSPVCNIQCKFCKRAINKLENRPGVSQKLLSPQEACNLVSKALDICPEITVVGIAGPGDTLASPNAIETFNLIHKEYPELINCLSTNGLLLERYANNIYNAGVRTVTVTVNAVDPEILKNICSWIVYDGVKYEGKEAAEILIEEQKRGIKKLAELDVLIKINIVLIPGINDFHIADIARTVKECGANLINIIPLIPQHELSDIEPPTCSQLNEARKAAEEYLPVFRHCQHCRADACGIPGKGDLSSLLYETSGIPQTFSHG